MKKSQMKKESSGDLGCTVLFLILLASLVSGIIYMMGKQMRVKPQNKPLYAIYDQQNFDGQKYHILSSNENRNVQHLLNAYAADRNYTLISRYYNKSELQLKAHTYIWSFTLTINHRLKWKTPKNNIWILYCQKHTPFKDIKEIQHSAPHDKIMVVSKQQLHLKRFITVDIPDLQLKKDLQTVLGFSKKLATKFTKLYPPGQLFDVIHENSSTEKGHIGKYYSSLDNLPKKQKNILKKLCGKGKINVGFPLKTMTKNLNNAGVLIHNQTAYWISDGFRINYMIYQGKKCQQSQIPIQAYYAASILEQQILKKHEEEEHKIQNQENIKENQCNCPVESERVKEKTRGQENSQNAVASEQVEQLKEKQELQQLESSLEKLQQTADEDEETQKQNEQQNEDQNDIQNQQNQAENEEQNEQLNQEENDQQTEEEEQNQVEELKEQNQDEEEEQNQVEEQEQNQDQNEEQNQTQNEEQNQQENEQKNQENQEQEAEVEEQQIKQDQQEKQNEQQPSQNDEPNIQQNEATNEDKQNQHSEEDAEQQQQSNEKQQQTNNEEVNQQQVRNDQITEEKGENNDEQQLSSQEQNQQSIEDVTQEKEAVHTRENTDL